MLQQYGACSFLMIIFHIFKPYSILDPTWECPKKQNLTKTEKVKLFLELIQRISPFSDPFLVQHTQKFDKLQNTLVKM